jgi:hypothetical protein
MNTLEDLNTYGQTQLSYTDSRDPDIIFDRPLPVNQEVSIAVGQTHTVPIGIDITEIIKPDLLNIFYEINVSSVAGATVAWDITPAGCSVSNPSTGVYRMNNIDTVAQWQIVRSPNIIIPSNREDNFTYTAAIKWDPTKTKSWSVAATVGIQATLTTTATVSCSLTGVQGSQSNMTSTATMFADAYNLKEAAATLTATSTVYADVFDLDLGAAGFAAAASLTATAKKFTGVTAPLTWQATLSATINRDYEPTARLNSAGTNASGYDAREIAMSKNGQWAVGRKFYSAVVSPINYSQDALALYQITANSIALVGQTPWLDYQTQPSGVEFAMSNNAEHVVAALRWSAPGSESQFKFYNRSGFTLTQTENIGIGSNIPYAVAISNDGQVVAIAAGPSPYTVKIYNNSLGTLTLTRTLTYTDPGWNNQGEATLSIEYAADIGEYFLMIDVVGDTRIYRSGNSYSSSVYQTISEQGNGHKLSTDATVAVVRTTLGNGHAIYERAASATTFTLTQTITELSTARYAEPEYGQAIDLINDGRTILVGDWGATVGQPKGQIFVYEKIGLYWEKTRTLTDYQLSGSETASTYNYYACNLSVSSTGQRLLVGRKDFGFSNWGSIIVYTDVNQV